MALTHSKNLHLVRESVVTVCVNILCNYRKMVASPQTAAGQLVLPESFKLLPLYTLSLTKSGIMRPGTEVRADERSYLMAMATRMPIMVSVGFIYPRLYHLLDLGESVGAVDAGNTPFLPTPLPLLVENLKHDGAFLIENAHVLYMWIGKSVPSEFANAIFSVKSLERVDSAELRVPLLQNEMSVRVNRLINAVRSQRPHILQMPRVLFPKDALEPRMVSMLTEDRMQTMMNYVEFLCHVHRQIQAKLL